MPEERRTNKSIRAILSYLNFEPPKHIELKPLATAFLGFKMGWFFLGLLSFFMVTNSGLFEAIPETARNMLGVAVLMAIWWISEAIPISITSLVPLVALPYLGIANAKTVSAPYADPNVFLFIGGFILASCMQRWNLHKRIALLILLKVGAAPKRILLGCMGVTAFLSMWASNTATVLMMYPIALALIDSGQSPSQKDRDNFSVCLLLAIAYAGSMGGTGTLIGTPPNIVFASMVRQLDVGIEEVSFLNWMGIGVPFMLVMLVLIYFLLTRVLFHFDAKSFTTDTEMLLKEKADLGPMTTAEKQIAFAFTSTALLWMTRKNIILGSLIIPGWSNLFEYGKYFHDGTVAIAVSILLFVIPVNRKEGIFLMDRDWFKSIPWDIVLLFGGGFALAKGFLSSGLSTFLGDQLGFVGAFHPLLVMLVISLFMTFITELTSNTATTTVMLPILAATATAAGHLPILYLLPATLAASAAFMLPVATPPNAIVFGSGRVTIPQMARSGLFLNLLSAPVIVAICYWLGPKVLGF